jgi:hypothetical protein
MRRTRGVVTAIAVLAALVATSATTGATQSRKAIRIDVQAQGYESCTGKFLLSLGSEGDAGKTECHLDFGASVKTRDGFGFDRVTLRLTFTGKAGTLAIVATGGVYDIGFGNSDVWEGTWRIVKGTGRYAGFLGGGVWKGADSRNNHSLASTYVGSVTGA